MGNKVRSKLKKIRRQLNQQQLIGIAVVIVFAGLGTYLLTTSHAASPYANSEAEAGTLGSGASLVSDANASSGTAVKFSSAGSSSISYPTTLSSNHRYYLDQNGTPWFLMGESAQALIANGTVADATTYFADRHAKGISGVWIMLIADGHPPSTRSDGSTYDGLLPFTTPGDLSTPNPAYWTRVDQILTAAQNNDVIVFANPAETAGMINTLKSNGATKDRAYGAFIGNRYKNYTNIVWLLGNDFQTWSTDPTGDADLAALSDGIKSAGDTHLQTIELNYFASTSLDDASTWGSRVSLNLAYSYYPTYDMIYHGYSQSPTMPTFYGEGSYEQTTTEGAGFDDPVSNYEVRLQGWWSMTSGAIGQLWGTRRIQDWNQSPLNYLNTIGVGEYIALKNFFKQSEWYNLVPDTPSSHNLVTAGYGTYVGSSGTTTGSKYVTSAITPDGKFGVAYLPSQATITVNMAKMSGTVTAQWFDPTTGNYTTIGTYPNSGSQQFTSPATTHYDGTNDWVLLLL